MPQADAAYLAGLVSEARDNFVTDAERELVKFHHQALLVLLDKDQTKARQELTPVGKALLIALAGLWLTHINWLYEKAHKHFGLPPPTPFSEADALDIMRPGVAALLSAAIRALRLNQATQAGLNSEQKTFTIRQAWEQQYQKGGAFTALRGSIRGATAGTFNTYVNASMIDTMHAQNRRKGAKEWILGAYNPLDERTGHLDYQLCTSTGGYPITTARGRSVTGIPGLIGKYTLDNAWVPGDPQVGGDTHYGCRCVLIPEKRP